MKNKELDCRVLHGDIALIVLILLAILGLIVGKMVNLRQYIYLIFYGCNPYLGESSMKRTMVLFVFLFGQYFIFGVSASFAYGLGIKRMSGLSRIFRLRKFNYA